LSRGVVTCTGFRALLLFHRARGGPPFGTGHFFHGFSHRGSLLPPFSRKNLSETSYSRPRLKFLTRVFNPHKGGFARGGAIKTPWGFGRRLADQICRETTLFFTHDRFLYGGAPSVFGGTTKHRIGVLLKKGLLFSPTNGLFATRQGPKAKAT